MNRVIEKGNHERGNSEPLITHWLSPRHNIHLVLSSTEVAHKNMERLSEKHQSVFTVEQHKQGGIRKNNDGVQCVPGQPYNFFCGSFYFILQDQSETNKQMHVWQVHRFDQVTPTASIFGLDSSKSELSTILTFVVF